MRKKGKWEQRGNENDGYGENEKKEELLKGFGELVELMEVPAEEPAKDK